MFGNKSQPSPSEVVSNTQTHRVVKFSGKLEGEQDRSNLLINFENILLIKSIGRNKIGQDLFEVHTLHSGKYIAEGYPVVSDLKNGPVF